MLRRGFRAYSGNQAPKWPFEVDWDNPTNRGLKADYPLIGETHGRDISGFGHHGIVGFGAFIAPAFLNARGADFAGPASLDEILLPTLETILGVSSPYAGPLSIECWAKGRSITTRAGLFHEGNVAGSSGIYLYYEESSGEFRFDVGSFPTNAAVKTATITDVNHVVGTWDGTTVQVYVNGVPGTSATDTTASTVNTGAFWGNVFPGFSREWDGQLNFASIHKATWSAREVMERFHPSTRWDRYLQPSNKSYSFPVAAGPFIPDYRFRHRFFS